MNGILTDTGVICPVLVRPDCAEAEVAAGLLEQCEQYLRSRGAKIIHGGGLRPFNPFYVGLYGGSELPGISRATRSPVRSSRRTATPRPNGRSSCTAT